jgi:hypothetical protein
MPISGAKNGVAAEITPINHLGSNQIRPLGVKTGLSYPKIISGRIGDAALCVPKTQTRT